MALFALKQVICLKKIINKYVHFLFQYFAELFRDYATKNNILTRISNMKDCEPEDTLTDEV